MGGKGSGAKPRVYPAWLVARVRELYESGLTIREIQTEVGAGVKVQRLMGSCGIPRRTAAKRNQAGPRNHMWKGQDARYQALHLRVQAERGTPSQCERCGRVDEEAKCEWANLSGRYEDVHDYERMCVGCHRTFDAARRRATGKPLTPEHLRRRRG